MPLNESTIDKLAEHACKSTIHEDFVLYKSKEKEHMYVLYAPQDELFDAYEHQVILNVASHNARYQVNLDVTIIDLPVCLENGNYLSKIQNNAELELLLVSGMFLSYFN